MLPLLSDLFNLFILTMVKQDQEVTIRQRFLWTTNTLFHVLETITVAFIFYVLIKNNKLTSDMFLHYFLTTGAYIPLMAEGFMLFSESNSWTLKLNRNTKGLIHTFLLAISTLCATAGMALISNMKNNMPGTPRHFTSNHAILGLTSWILCYVSTVTGLFALYSTKLKRFVRPVTTKTIHIFLGLACYATGMGSLVLGFHLGGFRAHVTPNELNVTIILVSILTVWSVVETLLTLFNNLKTMFS